MSSFTSISSSVLRGEIAEGGRTYSVFGKEGVNPYLSRGLKDSLTLCGIEYGLPMDETELNRLDMSHAKYYALLEKKRFLAPIGENPQKILDLGCGTGGLTSSFRGKGGWLIAGCRDLVY